MSKSLLYMLKVHMRIIWGWLGMGVDCGMKTLLGVLCVCVSHGRKKPYGQPGGKVTSAVQKDPRWPTEQFTNLTFFFKTKKAVFIPVAQFFFPGMDCSKLNACKRKPV